MILFSSSKDLTKLAEVRTLVASVPDSVGMNKPVHPKNMVPSVNEATETTHSRRIETVKLVSSLEELSPYLLT